MPVRRKTNAEDQPPPKARALALRLLARRDYTTAELRRKLNDRGCVAEDVGETLRALASSGLLDDRRAAAAHVRSGLAIKGRGRLRLKRELQHRGVAESTIRELTGTVTPEDEAAMIERILVRKRVPPRLSAAEHRRIFQQLMRRGFSPDAIATGLKTRRQS